MSRSYQSAKREHTGEPVTFDLDGETFTCVGYASTLDLSEFALRGESVNLNDPRVAGVFAEFFSVVLGDDVEYERFRRHVREHRTDEETQFEIIQGIVEDMHGRPTGRSSDSSDGPSTTGPISRVGSSPPAEHKVINLSTGRMRAMEDLSQEERQRLRDLGGDLASSG